MKKEEIKTLNLEQLKKLHKKIEKALDAGAVANYNEAYEMQQEVEERIIQLTIASYQK